MLNAYAWTLLISALLIAIPVLVGLPVALFGSGRASWGTALVALILSALGWSFATLLYGPGGDGGLESEGLGLFLSSLGVMLGLGACTVALIGTSRQCRWTWFVVLMLAAALPLVAGPALYDLLAVVIGPASLNETARIRLFDLAVLLPPLGCAVLVAFGAWSVHRRRRDPDVATV
jgi:hypothetical protein